MVGQRDLSNQAGQNIVILLTTYTRPEKVINQQSLTTTYCSNEDNSPHYQLEDILVWVNLLYCIIVLEEDKMKLRCEWWGRIPWWRTPYGAHGRHLPHSCCWSLTQHWGRVETYTCPWWTVSYQLQIHSIWAMLLSSLAIVLVNRYTRKMPSNVGWTWACYTIQNKS